VKRPLLTDLGCLKVMPRSRQTSHPVPTMKLLGIMFRIRCWPTTFHIITAGDDDGRMMFELVGVISPSLSRLHTDLRTLPVSTSQTLIPTCPRLLQSPATRFFFYKLCQSLFSSSHDFVLTCCGWQPHCCLMCRHFVIINSGYSTELGLCATNNFVGF
jgi:hypothetical protein